MFNLKLPDCGKFKPHAQKMQPLKFQDQSHYFPLQYLVLADLILLAILSLFDLLMSSVAIDFYFLFFSLFISQTLLKLIEISFRYLNLEQRYLTLLGNRTS